MKLQVALDTLTLDECLKLLEEARGYVDIAEVGTPFIIEEGMAPVKAIKQAFLNWKYWQMPRLWMPENLKPINVLKPVLISLPYWV